MKNNTLDELVEKARDGDTKAFDELVGREKERMTQYSLKICRGDDDMAAEVFQTAMIKAWKNIGKFHMQCAFHTWFYKIARNSFYDILRAKKNKKFYSLNQDFENRPAADQAKQTVDSCFGLDYSGGPSIFGYSIEDSEHLVSSRFPHEPDEACVEQDLKKLTDEIFSQILNKLSKNHRDVLEMREVKEMSYSDIAEKLNISLGTVMSRLYYARKRAQRIFKAMHNER